MNRLFIVMTLHVSRGTRSHVWGCKQWPLRHFAFTLLLVTQPIAKKASKGNPCKTVEHHGVAPMKQVNSWKCACFDMFWCWFSSSFIFRQCHRMPAWSTGSKIKDWKGPPSYGTYWGGKFLQSFVVLRVCVCVHVEDQLEWCNQREVQR